MNVLAAVAEIGKFIAKVPPDVRQVVVDVVRSIANGDDLDVVVEKSRRAALAVAAKKAYRRGPHI